MDLEASSLPRSCHLQVSVFLYHTPAEERADVGIVDLNVLTAMVEVESALYAAIST